jgi:hypothetical protein
MRIGAAGLLGTFAVAFLSHAIQHEFRVELLVFAAAVLFVAVHGPVSPNQLGRASRARTFARPDLSATAGHAGLCRRGAVG